MTSPLNYRGGRQFPQSILDDLNARLEVLEAASPVTFDAEALAIREAALEEAAAICESISAASNAPLFRSAGKICAGRIRAAIKLST